MSDFEYTEKNLYDLLFILCDMLSSENVSAHEEIMCDFIKIIELEGKPLKPFMKVLTKHKHLRSILEYTSENIPYAAQRNILEVMNEVWPEDIETINRLHHTAYMFHLGIRNNQPRPHISRRIFIQNLV